LIQTSDKAGCKQPDSGKSGSDKSGGEGNIPPFVLGGAYSASIPSGPAINSNGKAEAVISQSTSVPILFNRSLYRHRQKQTLNKSHPHSPYSRLLEEVSLRLIQRIGFFNRNFERVLFIGGNGDSSKKINEYLHSNKQTSFFLQSSGLLQPGICLNCDEEMLPIKSDSFDLIIHFMNLHAVNDVPGVLAQTKDALKKDGVMMAVFFGENTLQDLRQYMLSVDMEFFGGACQRVSSFIGTKTAGMLMQRAGFHMPVSDLDRLEVNYDDLLSLFKDIKYAGLRNFLNQQPSVPFNKKILARLQDVYLNNSKPLAGGDDLVPKQLTVGLDLVYMVGIKG